MRNSCPRLTFSRCAAACVILLTLLLASCGTSKNTPYSRKYQAFITRYNVYFNGDEHFKETLKKMEKEYQDEYSRRLYMHPAEAKINPKAPQPAGSFERSIEKAQKAIQLHSIKKRPKKKSGKANDPAYKAWMKREEYNPFLHNAWMLMARSQYFGGDFAGAASTFGYISKHFSWLPATVTEARLWEARSYVAQDWLFEAETILRRIKPETDLTNSTLRELYYFTYADFYVRSHRYGEAVPMLEEACRSAKGTQKVRLNYLLGQILSELGRKKEAYEAFRRAASAGSADYRAKFNARIKQSEVYEGSDIEPEVKALRRMTRYDRNKEYLDQIYYAIGNLYLSRKDTAQAIEYYRLGVEKATRSGLDKALVQLSLGRLYFDRRQYDLAQPCYSEAVPQLPDDFKDLAQIKHRSDVLDELAVYAGNVALQDSLLRLADMPPEQQLAVVNKIIEELKKKEKEAEEEARRAEFEAEQSAQGDLINNNNAPSSFNLNTDNSWYYYNTQTRNSGKTEFQRRWGSRKLEDNWRRRNKNTFSMSDFDSSDTQEETDSVPSDRPDAADNDSTRQALAAASDPHNPEFYLKDIPKTPEQRATANEIIQEGLFNEGLILKDKLEDFPAATDLWDELLRRYPDNVYRLDVYYNLFLMNARLGDAARTEQWRQLILKEFPDSKEGIAVADPQFIENLRRMDAEQESLYAATLDDYLENRNARVHAAYEDMSRKYPMSEIMPKFMFLDALAYATENKPEQFNSTLKELLERYPQTDITPLASSYLKALAAGRKLQSTGTNMRGMLWDIRLSTDSTAGAGASGQPLKLELDPDAKQDLILLFSLDSVPPNLLLYEVARHNFSTYVVRDFELQQMQFGRLGLLIISGLTNKADAERYRDALIKDPTVSLMPMVRPVIISEKDFDTMLRQGSSFEEYFNLTQERDIEQTEEKVLGSAPGSEGLRPSPATDSVAAPAGKPSGDAGQRPAAPTGGEGLRPSSATDSVATPAGKLSGDAGQRPAAPAPAPAPKPVIPDYPDGSEGDDPLLD